MALATVALLVGMFAVAKTAGSVHADIIEVDPEDGHIPIGGEQRIKVAVSDTEGRPTSLRFHVLPQHVGITVDSSPQETTQDTTFVVTISASQDAALDGFVLQIEELYFNDNTVGQPWEWKFEVVEPTEEPVTTSATGGASVTKTTNPRDTKTETPLPTKFESASPTSPSRTPVGLGKDDSGGGDGVLGLSWPVLIAGLTVAVVVIGFVMWSLTRRSVRYGYRLDDLGAQYEMPKRRIRIDSYDEEANGGDVADGGGGGLRPKPPTGGGRPPTGADATANGGATAGVAGVTGATKTIPDSAFPRIDCPDVAKAQEQFVLRVGLSEKEDPYVVGGEMRRPDRLKGPYKLTVKVDVPGLSLAVGESWTNMLDVTYEDPYPFTELHVTASAQAEPVWPTTLTVDYMIGSQPMGMGERSLTIIADETFRNQVDIGPDVGAGTLTVPDTENPPDILVYLRHRKQTGEIKWGITTCFTDLQVNDDALYSRPEGSPEDFARELVDSADTFDEEAGIEETMRGLGKKITPLVPEPFWETLTKVRTRKGGPPTVLIMTTEGFIPWELAWVPKEYRDPNEGELLGAQAAVGRWVLAPNRPPAPSAKPVVMTGLGVVAGMYRGPRRLKGAKPEWKELSTKYHATEIKATRTSVIDYLRKLEEDGATDSLLHFAVHGKLGGAVTTDGLILTDVAGGEAIPIPSTFVEGLEFSCHPFVFINACQVGGATRSLNGYSGMARAFLDAGACGMVAPLWSISDGVSVKISTSFYASVFKQTSPAEALRQARSLFMKNPGYRSATCLAYQYYGHPGLKLSLEEDDK